jgi:hypothetical protein
MAEEVTAPSADERPVALFNSALETGVRAVVILDAIHPRAFDIAHLAWCDHLVVHTEDIGGPPSLHPDIPQRTGELLVRRRLVEDGVNLMRRLHMIDVDVGENGIRFIASEEASSFVEALRTDYAVTLKDRAGWLADYLLEKSDADLAQIISDRIGRWTVEFLGGLGEAGAL